MRIRSATAAGQGVVIIVGWGGDGKHSDRQDIGPGCSEDASPTEYPSPISEEQSESSGRSDPEQDSGIESAAPEPTDESPRVLAVVVAHDPGDSFDQTLVSLGAQSYPSLGVIVVDLCENRRLDARVSELLPAARVHRPDDPGLGYCAAVNSAVALGVDTTYYLFCHDDVFLEPEAVSEMVAEASRSRAAVVGPKFVQWDSPDTLLHVGVSCDKFAVTGELAGAGEFDQGQRDAVADVLVTPGGVQLVHAGLFEAIGGFDEAMSLTGEDVDLCWRAQVAGARIVVAPDAVVRHVEALEDRVDIYVDRLRRRHQLRTMLGTYSATSLVLVLPQLLLLTIASALVSLFTLRVGRSGATVGAWMWNLRRLSSARARRSVLREVRQIPDRELRHLQQRGSIRAGRFVHGVADSDEGVIAQSRETMATSWRDTPLRVSVLAAVVFVALYVFGSRGLFSGIPFVGEFAPFPEGVEGFFTQWWDGWRPVGMGDSGSSPIGLGMLGVANWIVLGASGLLRAVVILGLIPLGVFGAWRLLRATTSNRARVVCAVVYAVNPIAYNAVAKADWTALIAYAATPFVFAGLARSLGATPFGDRGGPAGPSGDWSMLRIVVGTGLVMAVAVAYAPIMLAVVAVIALGLLLGSICGGHPARLVRLVFGAVAVVAIAAALNAPFLIDIARDGGTWATLGSAQDAVPTDLSLVEMLRFDTGPIEVGWLGWAVLVPAALALFLARGWRLVWAIRGWFVAMAAWGLAWADEWGALPVALRQTDLLLAVAGLGLGVAAGMAAIAVDVDVEDRRAVFRRSLPAVGFAALVVWSIPMVGAAFDGMWLLPRRDLSIPLSVMDDPVEEGGFRVLWIGEPDVLGLRGYRLDGTLAYGTSDDGPASISYRWIDEPSTGVDDLGDALRVALAGQQNRLGAQLADFGVRYVVVVERLGERPFGEIERPVDPAVLAALSEQLDLRRIEGVNEAVTIFENAAAASTRRSVPRVDEGSAAVVDTGEPALVDQVDSKSFEGIVGSERDVVAAYNSDSGWSIDVSDRSAGRAVHDGWANSFSVAEGGDGRLSYDTATEERLARFAQIIGFLVLAMVVLRLRTARDRAAGQVS